MKFNKLCENALSETSLTRIRLKCDPRERSHDDFRHLDTYEGYVLEESEGIVTIMIPKIGSQEVPSSMICNEPHLPDELGLFKKAAVTYVKDNCGCNTGQLIEQIIGCNDPHFIETYLREYGLSDDDVLSIYKLYYNSHE